MAQKTYYWLKAEPKWLEVTKEVWIKAERDAGFQPMGISISDPNYMAICATGGFSNGVVSGAVTYSQYPPIR